MTPDDGDDDDDDDDGGKDGRCRSGQGGALRVASRVAATIGANATASGGELAFSHSCPDTAVRLRSATLNLAGDPSFLRSITAVASGRGETRTVTVTPIGSRATFVFNPPIILGRPNTASIKFTLSTQASIASLVNPLTGGILFCVAMPFVSGRSRRRQLMILVMIAAFALTQSSCGDDDNGSDSPGIGGGRSTTITVVAVDAADPSRTISVGGLPAELGTVTLK